MKNILVLKYYKLKNYDLGTKIEDYNQMKEWCVETAKKNIMGLDDIVVHDTVVQDIQDAFRQHFYDLYDLWKTQKFNILYSDLDVLFIRKLDWFNISKKFILYNGGNSGIRYHGHDMDEKLWQHAFKLAKKWDGLKWHFEQDIYKDMYRHPANGKFFKQDLVINLPRLDDPKVLHENAYINNIAAIHFHASNGDKQFIRMKNMYHFLKTINY
jgi:hypothetical protein